MNPNALTVSSEQLLREISRTLSDGQSVTIAVTGRSMLPTLRPDGDSVTLTPTDDYCPLDIVAANISGAIVIHRILSISDNSVTLQGDGNLSKTETCTPADLLGRVTAIARPEHPAYDPRTRTRIRNACRWIRLRPLRRPLLKLYTLLHPLKRFTPNS